MRAKKMSGSGDGRRPFFCWAALLVCFAVSSCPAWGQPQKQAAAGGPSSSAPTGAQAKAAVEKLFGPVVEPAARHKPYFLSGDFNGDTFADLLVLVLLKGAKNRLPPGVTVLDPFGDEQKGAPGAAAPTLALAIIHGTAAGGWNTESPAGQFLLTDRDFFSTPSWEAAQAGLVSLKKRRGRGGALRSAKGDAVALATEAGIDVLLYWDGKTYKLFTPQEEP